MLESLSRVSWLGALTLVALLAGCATRYHASLSTAASEECRSLEAVLSEREEFGVATASPSAEEDALRHCGLPHSSGGGPPFRQTAYAQEGRAAFPPAQSNSLTEEVRIEKRGNTYTVPVRINRTITLPFILDTGADELTIPADVALTLIRAGALTDSDFVGKARYSMANGEEQLGDRVILREVQVGDYTVKNVTAFVSPPAGDPLLGQSFLSKFGSVTVDYKRLVLVLAH